DQNGSSLNVHWSITPQIGTVSSAGSYAAPASIKSATAITITANPTGNQARSVSGTVMLMPSTPQLLSLACLPNTGTTSCTVTLSAPAHTAGTTVSMAPATTGGLMAPALWPI